MQAYLIWQLPVETSTLEILKLLHCELFLMVQIVLKFFFLFMWFYVVLYYCC